MAAPKSVLGELHETLAQLMLNELRWYMEQDPPIPLPAADKAAMAKFLKDNAITCDPADAADLEALRDQLHGKRAATSTRLKEKLRLVQADVESLYG